MELTYHRKGDYLFPNLVLEEKDITIGKYGMLRRTFLKEHKKGWYQSMLLSEKLDQHLVRIEKAADKRIDVLMQGLVKKNPAPDKETAQLLWAAHMNGLKEMAEEIVLKELVYC
ncbi:TnpV protein [Lachnospiraceae bacterium 48-21]|jgi:hypothetical protein